MKKYFRSLLALAMMATLPMSAFGLTIVSQDFEDGLVPAGAWNWTGGAATTNTASIVDYNGSKWRQMQSSVNSASGTTGRYGYKMNITVAGNTSADPADYFVEFDVVNLAGDWTTVNLAIAVLTNTGGDNGTTSVGYGSPTTAVTREAGVVRVKWQLSELTSGWWQGTNWDLTSPNWSYEINMPDTAVAAGTSFTQQILLDNFRIVYGSDEQPYQPVVLPENIGGSVGTLIDDDEVEVELTWLAGADPDISRGYTVNPDIHGYYILLSTGAPSDPNLYYIDYMEQVHDADPELTAPENSYGPYYLAPSTEYQWQVIQAKKEGIDDKSGIDEPNSIASAVWSFTTVGVEPVIVTNPAHTLVDGDGNASFTVLANNVATDYRWFKVGTESDTMLTDGGKYSGTQTTTLALTGATIADEGQYYVVAYNGSPDSGGVASQPSAYAKLWTPRLTSHFEFETLVGNLSVDSVDGFDVTINKTTLDGEEPVADAELVGGLPELGGNALSFGANSGTTQSGNYGVMLPGVVDYNDITISAWFNRAQGNPWQRIIDCGNGQNSNIFITASNDANQIRFAARINGGTTYGINTPNTPVGEWTYVVATISNGVGRLYVNGEYKGTANMPIKPIDIAAANNYIGRSNWPDSYFNGIIDDLKIYNYARTTEEVALDYLALKGEWICDRENYDLVHDFDNNCQVDILDFAEFAGTWMDSYRIYPADQE